jgi:hypothetical protein
VGWCLEVHGLAVSKLVAGREKDMEFVRVLVRENMARRAVLRERARTLDLPSERPAIIDARLAALPDNP